jgi:hypothetical protein
MNKLYDVYEKAMKVIDSCDNELHLVGAINYCNLFKDQFIKNGGDEVMVEIYHRNLINHLNYRINENYGN